MNRFGSKLGALWSASTSPVFGSMRHRAALQRVAEQRRREALQIEVDVRVQRRRADSGADRAAAACLAHDAAARIDFDEVRAFLAAQLRLVLLLEPALADLLPGL